MGERKLATVRIIKEIQNIPNADNIELAKIDGWQCVVKKDEFKIGEKIIYFEIDSFLPIKPEYEFLRKSCYKNTENLGEGFRIKTIKLRDTLSQGLIFSLKDKNLEIGKDLTDILNIKLYEKIIPECVSGEIVGDFPYFIPKTNQERIQNIYDYIKTTNDIYEVTIKLDGTSVTIFRDNDNNLRACSRNYELKFSNGNIMNNSIIKMALKYQNFIEKNKAYQFELIGPGIQKNPHKCNQPDIYLFDIYDIENKKYIAPLERIKNNNFPHVPLLGYITVNDKNLESLLKCAKKYKSINNTMSEGIVLKSLTNENHHFKIINNDYLLNKK